MTQRDDWLNADNIIDLQDHSMRGKLRRKFNSLKKHIPVLVTIIGIAVSIILIFS